MSEDVILKVRDITIKVWQTSFLISKSSVVFGCEKMPFPHFKTFLKTHYSKMWLIDASDKSIKLIGGQSS